MPLGMSAEPHHYAYPLLRIWATQLGEVIVYPTDLWGFKVCGPEMPVLDNLCWWLSTPAPAGAAPEIVADWSRFLETSLLRDHLGRDLAEPKPRKPLCGLDLPGPWTPYGELSTCRACQTSRERLEAVLGQYRAQAEDYTNLALRNRALQGEVDEMRKSLDSHRDQFIPTAHDRLLADDD